MTKKPISEARRFKLASEGYGFEKIEHKTAEGTYCDGCNTLHRRPTKMYSNGRDTMCRVAVINFYFDEEMAE